MARPSPRPDYNSDDLGQQAYATKPRHGGPTKPTASVLMPTLPQKPFQQLTWRMWRLTTLVSKTGAVAHNFPIGMSFGSCIEHLHIKLLVDWLRTRTGFFCGFQLCHGNKTSAQRDRNA